MSALIKVALADLAKVERSKKFVVNMSTWMAQGHRGPCEVCFAGSVMAKSLGAVMEVGHCGAMCYPEDFSDRNAQAFYALNCLRNGQVSSAARHLGRLAAHRLEPLDRRVVAYGIAPKAWRRDMRKLVRDLEAEGL